MAAYDSLDHYVADLYIYMLSVYGRVRHVRLFQIEGLSRAVAFVPTVRYARVVFNRYNRIAVRACYKVVAVFPCAGCVAVYAELDTFNGLFGLCHIAPLEHAEGTDVFLGLVDYFVGLSHGVAVYGEGAVRNVCRAGHYYRINGVVPVVAGRNTGLSSCT